MYGCFDSYVIYGVMEGDRYRILDQEWLESAYPEMDTYASDVVRNIMGNATYGYTLHFDQVTGQAQATKSQKETVQQLYTLLCEYCEGEGIPKPDFGYFRVVGGDYEKDHYEYVPDSN